MPVIYVVCFLSGMLSSFLIMVIAIIVKRPNNKMAEEHLLIVKEQLKVFHQRMFEERRLADCLEAIIKRIVSEDDGR